ncbi:unnamed protein product [Caenorhabditis angaria]|uniref:Uncharacterized protein n=1 Tax=Caenorhabditis angaria TaxID=860376 RepID=A0A9P1J7K5_9PELO|nr:unnamed protein product [Caenorhabditis angaria]
MIGLNWRNCKNPRSQTAAENYDPTRSHKIKNSEQHSKDAYSTIDWINQRLLQCGRLAKKIEKKPNSGMLSQI